MAPLPEAIPVLSSSSAALNGKNCSFTGEEATKSSRFATREGDLIWGNAWPNLVALSAKSAKPGRKQMGKISNFAGPQLQSWLGKVVDQLVTCVDLGNGRAMEGLRLNSPYIPGLLRNCTHVQVDPRGPNEE